MATEVVNKKKSSVTAAKSLESLIDIYIVFIYYRILFCIEKNSFIAIDELISYDYLHDK